MMISSRATASACTMRRQAFATSVRCSSQQSVRPVLRAAPEQQSGPTSTAEPSAPAPSSSTPAAEPYKRTFKSLGSEVIEQNTAFEEPPAKDMWEGEQFEALGQTMERWFLPLLVVLGLICGGIAASSYNEDADVFIKPAAGPDELPTTVPASVLVQAQQQQQSQAAPAVSAE